MNPNREMQIRQCLEQAFQPEELLVKDQSHLHVGHEGARDGKGHFDVTIVAPAFEGASRLRRHQMVYDALADLLESEIHALRIHARAPSEP
ncbi:MAG TPA: BolA family protein [Woeseiaceae bacterium]|nr:BolA family protein [Woeseiaceae bacterium]